MNQRDALTGFVAAASFAAFILVIFGLGGCPPQPIPPQPPQDLLHVAPACAADMGLPVQADVCDGLVTAEGLACVRCAGRGCLDVVDVVYCVDGATCAADKRCRPDVSFGAARRLKRIRR